MNRYEISISNSIGHESTYLGMYTIHASSPRVALQRVIQRRLDFPMKLLPNASMISLKFDVVNRGKVIEIAEVRWEDCYEHLVTIDGEQYYTRDDNDDRQVERKFFGYRTEYILADEPIPEGWEVYKQNAPYQYRFKPTARLAVLMAR
jgi:type IV secretory pathway ATPase VirB11/archaellum biosynthesis ATPase